MSFLLRIRTIYWKELIDILRDRRTLIAMIVVPIVLYPLLMIGSVQALSYQSDTLSLERFRIGVTRDQHRRMLDELIALDSEMAEQQTQTNHNNDNINPEDAQPISLKDVEIAVFETREQLDDAIRNRSVQVGVIFEHDVLLREMDRQNKAEILMDKEEVRSAIAGRRVDEMIGRIGEATVETRKKEAHLPEVFDQPFELTVTDLSSPPSILGQILPLILILMTITGAIYPAIDLTAGERERGTLETLMVCPVAVIDLIVGKFLVVTTVAIMGATLNLASVSATVYFGGFDRMISSTSGSVPWLQMLLILLCLVPFAVLMSAIMIAVCSYARTFKEAQNYVTPVILAVLIPGGIAAFPATRLEGVMLVMPVGNMVLLARELLLGATVPAWQIFAVVAATTLYAAAAVAVAAGVFGRESVVFADAGSVKGLLSRKLIQSRSAPSLSVSLLYIALLFPGWFFIQSAVSPEGGDGTIRLLQATALLMPLFFVMIPAFLIWYFKTQWRETFFLRIPKLRFWAAAVLLGLFVWIPVHELNAIQQSVLPLPSSLTEALAKLSEAIESLPPLKALLFLAIVPAICEELLFRGFLLSGLASSATRWTAILVSAAIFGVFHFILFKFIPTAVLGIVLAFLCIQSRSILPGMLMHLLHNGLAVASVFWPWQRWLGLDSENVEIYLPGGVLALGIAAVIIGLALCATKTPRDRLPPAL